MSATPDGSNQISKDQLPPTVTDVASSSSSHPSPLFTLYTPSSWSVSRTGIWLNNRLPSDTMVGMWWMSGVVSYQVYL